MTGTKSKRPPSHRCFDCNLPDPYKGHGDGIGSCQCPRCEYCGWPPGTCNCSDDYPGWPDEEIPS